MNLDLINQIKKSRQGTIKIGTCTFIYSRPTDAEAITVSKGTLSDYDVARMFVIGWTDVKASDILSSAGSDPLEFDSSLWAEWLADRPDFWKPISDRVIESYKLHVERLKDAAKN